MTENNKDDEVVEATTWIVLAGFTFACAAMLLILAAMVLGLVWLWKAVMA